jgi:rubrerythrin
MNLKGSKTEDNLKVAFAGETHEYTDMYPGMAKTAPGRGLRGDRRLVRDPGQGGALPRQPLPEAPGRTRRLRFRVPEAAARKVSPGPERRSVIHERDEL